MWLQVTIGTRSREFFSMPENTPRIQLLNLTLESTKKINGFKKIFHAGQKHD